MYFCMEDNRSQNIINSKSQLLIDTKLDTWLNTSKRKTNNWELVSHGVPHFWLPEVKRFDNFFPWQAPVHIEINTQNDTLQH